MSSSTIWPLKLTTATQKKPNGCQSCPLRGDGNGFGFPETGGTNGVGVVVESIDDQGILQGASGWQFNHLLKRAGIKREDWAFIDSVIHCAPPNHKLVGQYYEHEAVRQCAGYLSNTIDTQQPRALVALGMSPLKALTDQTGSISRNRGFVFDSKFGVPTVGTFNPSFLLPKRKEKSASKYTWVVIMDLKKAIRIAQGKRRMFPQHYLLDPSLDVAEEFIGEWERTGQEVKMAWDLETAYKMKAKNEQKLKLEDKQTVLRMSLAFRQGYAMTFPYTPEYRRRIIDRVFRQRRQFVGWNSKGFDEPIVLLQEGWEINGVLLDGMDQFHVFQPNIERNLEFATSILSDHLQPWKHLSQAQPEWYSAEDADATITDVMALDEMMVQVPIPDYPEPAPFDWRTNA